MTTAELEALKAAARQRLAAGQGELDLGLPPGLRRRAAGDHLLADGAPVDALGRAYDVLGFGQATGGDEVFRQLVLARIIEPASKQDSLRVLEEAGVAAASYPTLNRRLPAYAHGLVAAAAVGGLRRARPAGPGRLVLYDVSTLYFETDQRRRVPRARVLQGTPAGAADHHRAADRRRPGSR